MLHEGHPGQTRMKLLARSHVFWRDIDRDIDVHVRSCDQCQRAAKLPLKVPLTPWPQARTPMERVHCDFAGPVNGKMYLVVVDAFSRWPEIFEMKHASSFLTVQKLEELFSRFGSPATIVTDNGTQFTSSLFKNFCRTFGITHLRSPPFHPQANGLAERFVDTFKKGIAKIGGTDISSSGLASFLRSYRSTPCPSNKQDSTPAKAFLGRELNTPLSQLHWKSLKRRKCTYTDGKYYNQHHGTKEKTFKPGDLVYIRDFRTPNKPKWVAGKVLKTYGRSLCHVEVNQHPGLVWTRHMNQLRKRCDEYGLNVLLEEFDMIPCEAASYNKQAEVSDDVSLRSSGLPTTLDRSWNEDSGDEEETEDVPIACRLPNRNRRPPRRLQVRPNQKSYD